MKFSKTLIFSALMCGLSYNQATAQTAPSFGAASSFAVLAATTITNTGNTVITGDIGVSPGTSITGFGPGVINSGSRYSAVASLAGPAKIDALAAYTSLITTSQLPGAINLTGAELGQTAGAITLTPGVYNFSSSAGITGRLTLDDQGDPNALFVFTMGSTLTTASYSEVVMSSGGKGVNVFWLCGSSATIGTYTKMLGNIMAVASITMTTGATNTGRLIALNAAVTLDNNTAFALSSAPTDSDGDLVPDTMDDFPNDKDLAFNNFSSPGSGSTTAFEDNWPLIGDFDLNDLVMVSKYNIITNANNKVVKVIGNFTLKVAKSGYDNGFGVEFPIARNLVDSISGGTLEAGQTKAVVILFTDSKAELATVAVGSPKTYTVSLRIANGPDYSQFGTDYNPFIFNYKGSSRREVHLIGKTPTTLADLNVFGTYYDNSNVAAGRYYESNTGLPWAISIPTATFEEPDEFVDVASIYLHFIDWAQSGGTLFKDWYSNLAPGYRK
jgi:LruC domain-containing protein